MKKLMFFIVVLLCGVASAESEALYYSNPLINADMSDPDVIRVGEKYYMVTSEFHFMGMLVYESSDLVNWRAVGKVYERLPFREYDEMKRYAGGSWAPALRWHNGEFYVYFCTPGEGLFMTKAKRAEGPWEPLHCVKKVEKWEDPCPFWDEDGQAYLGHSLYGAGPIIVHRMSADGRELLDDGVTVYEGPVAEGTKIHKWNGEYYMSIPEGGVCCGWQTILRSKSIYGPWERKVVLEQGSTDVNGPHQGAIVDSPDGRWWFFHFQETDALGRVLHLQPMRWSADGWPVIGEDFDGNGVGEPVFGGLVGSQHTDGVFKHTDGVFKHTNLTNSNEFGTCWTVKDAAEKYSFKFVEFVCQKEDTVCKEREGFVCYSGYCPWEDLNWQFNHNPDSAAFSFDEVPGTFTIHALPAKSFKEARNTLTRKAVGFESEYTTAMSLERMEEGQRAGLVCMGKTNNMLGAVMKGGRRYLYIATDTSETILCELPIEMQHRSLMSSKAEKNHEGIEIAPQNGGPIHPLFLRLSMDMPNKTFRFFYSFDGLNYEQAGADFYTRWGNWKGVRPGLFSYKHTNLTNSTNSKKKNKKETILNGAVSFLWFKQVIDGNDSEGLEAKSIEERTIVENIARTSFPERTIDVYPQLNNTSLPSHHGEGSGERLLQQAIDSCSFLGGGRVVVHSGTYFLRGSLVMKSDVNLHLQEGATLLFSGDADDFLPEVFTRWEGTELFGHSPMIYALHANNIAITGKGVIDGNGGKEMTAWAAKEADDRDRLRAQGEELKPLSERIYGKGTILRPTCVEFVGCSRILVEGVTIKNSPFWTIHPLYCDNVIVRGVTIDTHFANNDGCDPESSSNVLIEHCVFNVGDDAVAIKSGRDADGRRVGRPSKNIVIRHCLFNSECNGLCIGSEMSGGVENVYMHDIQIGTVKNAVYFKSNRDRGGYIRNVCVSDITVRHALGAILRFETNYFGFRGGRHASEYKHFRIKNINAVKSDNYAFFISGYPEKPVRDIEISNCVVKEVKDAPYLHCTEGVTFTNVSVNGSLLPQHIDDDPEECTLDVW